MRRGLAAASLLGALARAAPLVQAVRRRAGSGALTEAGTDLQAELFLADAGSRKPRRLLQRKAEEGPASLDRNEDEEDHLDLTMADLISGRSRKELDELTMADLISGRAHKARIGGNASNGSYGEAAPVSGVWAHLRGREARPEAVVAFEEVPAYETEAWTTVLYARKLGPHRPAATADQLLGNLSAFFNSAAAVDWYFLTTVLAVIIAMDVAILQQLPETSRTHVVLLFFWLMVTIVFCVEIWLRLGPQAGVVWVTGYALEVIFSADNIFVIHLLFCTFETPRRLMAKALFIGLLSSIGFRFLFLLGLANALDSLMVIPYLVGLWLIYCGTKQVTVHEDEAVDVTQTAIVRSFRSLLGARLGEFYDEEGEAVFAVQKGKYCMTLLGIVVICLLSADFFLAFDVMLTKAEELPNPYLSFSSSAMAMFTVRAIFFAMRDLFSRFGVVRYGLGLVLLFMGAETLLSRAIYVNALMSCFIISAIVVVSLVLSWARGPCPKTVL
mmetsp:Transcript_9015/g.21418  ORF Transcript_9015/g.21418 Transcript_9015/m.21418 type:complete len:500 (-) Transcript_9015:52-1551(-)